MLEPEKVRNAIHMPFYSELYVILCVLQNYLIVILIPCNKKKFIGNFLHARLVQIVVGCRFTVKIEQSYVYNTAILVTINCCMTHVKTK